MEATILNLFSCMSFNLYRIILLKCCSYRTLNNFFAKLNLFCNIEIPFCVKINNMC